MNRNSVSILALILVLSPAVLAGCDSIGNAPAGPSQAEVKKEVDAMPPEKQIRLIQHSPMPRDEQIQKIDEIKKKYNLTGDFPPGGGAPPGGPPAGGSGQN